MLLGHISNIVSLRAMTELDQKWNMQYEQLVEFKRKNDHCMVPRSYDQDKSLGEWVKTQRTLHKNNKLRLDRKIILDAIGFVWKAYRARTSKPADDKLWHRQYEKLVEFKRTNGHCMVPSKYKQEKSLGSWVSTQRSNHRNDLFQQYRKDLLDEIGFAWKGEGVRNYKLCDKLWHQKYERLVEFKRKHGHCRVPSIYEQDKALGDWVRTQRRNHTRNIMQLDRKGLLDKIGFAWKYITLAARASTTDVRDLAICIMSRFGQTDYYVSHFRSFSAYLCRIRIRKRSPAVWVSQTKH
jgi:uncharacterized protein YbgA (DUF1722 family)